MRGHRRVVMLHDVVNLEQLHSVFDSNSESLKFY